MDPFKPYQPRPKTVVPILSDGDSEIVALRAMAYIAADENLMKRFINLTGLGDAEELRVRLTDRAFLGSILDFVLGDERTTVAFAQTMDLAPEVPMIARARLP